MGKEKFISVTFNLNNANGKFTFPNNNELNGKTVTGISLVDNSASDVYASDGNQMPTNAAINTAFITLQRDSTNLVLTVPLKHFQQKDGDRSIRPINIDGFNPGTSFIQFVKNAAGNYVYTVGQSIDLIVSYID